MNDSLQKPHYRYYFFVCANLTSIVRKYFSGPGSDYRFVPARSITLPPIDRTDLYIHIPFCKNMCPYCPYNKVEYDKALASRYKDALLREIEFYRERLGRIEITSVYVGGGTPTNLIDELFEIVFSLRKNFEITGELAIETTPSDISEEVVKKLSRWGFGLVSLGVQSFNEKYLELIGRNYASETLDSAIRKTLKAGFKTVNIDLMFALPGQTVEEMLADIKKAVDHGVDQITLYPLFTFPYSRTGHYLHLKKVRMPNLQLRRVMYKSMHDYLEASGFERVSVWGFRRGDPPRYSSVTRNKYIGLGAGAASYLPGVFYFNTFPPEAYIESCLDGKLPVSLKMDVSESMERFYWLYWRFYDTYIPKSQLNIKISKDLRKIRTPLEIARILGIWTQDKHTISLTERGSFWLHLAQNYFILNYIDKVWSESIKQPWPKEIKI